MLKRRAMFGGLIALAAPAIIRTPGLLMPIKMFASSPETTVLEILVKHLSVCEVSRHEFAEHFNRLFIYGYAETLIDVQ
jgi:hypothetical protein